MTAFERNNSLLTAFGIPKGDGESQIRVREILARLLSLHVLRLANLQTVRDIVEHAKVEDPEACIFLAAMFISENQGNAFMKEDDLLKILTKSGHVEKSQELGLAETNEKYEVKVKEVCKAFDAAEWKGRLIGEIVNCEESRWYFQRNLAAVHELNAILAKMSKAKECGDVSPEVIAQAATFKGFSLNEAQKVALAAAVAQRFTVITGGPGTGKTTTVCAILRALLAMNTEWTEADIALAAPTGRAAQRMQEAILDQCKGSVSKERIGELARKLEGTTVHRLLGGYAPNWKHDEKHPLEKKVIIVDETSMVDLYLMQALLKALPKDARLILLGDADQLPSVDTGAVLGDLTRLGMGTDVVKRLEVCERAKGEIYDASKAINDSDGKPESAQKLIDGWTEKRMRIQAEDLPCGTGLIEDGKSEFRWLEPGEDIRKPDIMECYSKWMSGNQLAELAREIDRNDKSLLGDKSPASEALFAELNRRRVLTLVRDGWYGVKEANAHLLRESKRRANKTSVDYLALVGVPIMVTKNTPERKLFNGDVGVTVKSANGMVVLFPRGEKTVVCPVSLLPEHELAYAMTVHKSQGSEFENVMVVLPNDPEHPLLTRQILYTGLTRAKKRAVLFGTEKSLKVALVRKLERDTGITIRYLLPMRK